MSTSIPIPPRPQRTCSASPTLSDSTLHFGSSLPSRPTSILHSADLQHGKSSRSIHTPPGKTPGSTKSSSSHKLRRRHQLSKDDMAVPSIKLISKAARRWDSSASPSATSSSILRDADYSEVVTATDQVRTLFQEGSAITKRPPRAGVSGTYFFCQGEGDGDTIGVFKPMDEEAKSINMSPSLSPTSSIPASLPNMPIEHIDMLGAAHSSASASTSSSLIHPSSPPAALASPNRSSPLFSRGCSGASDSDGAGCTGNTVNSHTHSNMNMSATAASNQTAPFAATRSNAIGFQPGEGAYREVAAYILDHERFAGVPQTALMRMDKPYSFIDNSDEDENEEDSDSDDDGLDMGGATDHYDASPLNVIDDDDDDDIEGDTDDEFSAEVIVHSGTTLGPAEFNGSLDDDFGLEGSTFDSGDEGEEGSTLSSSSSGSVHNGGDGHHKGSERPGTSNFQTKMGAFQVYVKNVGDADDFGPGVFDKDQVHRIAILDIRTLNHDRHGGNILVRKSSSESHGWAYSPSSSSSEFTTTGRKYDLVPIDHGYIMPDHIQHVPWPVWMDWPMMKKPVSPQIRDYVKFLDADRDERLLRDELKDVFRPGALQSLHIATTLLQKGIAAGLTLYDIGLLIYSRRDEPFDRTELFKIVSEAEEAFKARERHIEALRRIEQAGLGLPISSASSSTSSFLPSPPSASTDTLPAPKPLRKHHRHQSSNAIVGAALQDRSFVVKYAARQISELVARIAAAKDEAKAKANAKAREKSATKGTSKPPAPFRCTASSVAPDFSGPQRDEPLAWCARAPVNNLAASRPRPPYLTRVRSIPDFGIGEKPVQVILGQRRSGAGTPASSPPPPLSHIQERVQAQLTRTKTPPIRIPINVDHVKRIDRAVIAAAMNAPVRDASAKLEAVEGDVDADSEGEVEVEVEAEGGHRIEGPNERSFKAQGAAQGQGKVQGATKGVGNGVQQFLLNEKSSPVSPIAAFSWAGSAS